MCVCELHELNENLSYNKLHRVSYLNGVLPVFSKTSFYVLFSLPNALT